MHDRTFIVIVDRPEGADTRIYVDTNGNGDLTDDPPASWTRPGGPGDETIPVLEDALVHEVVEQIAPLVIMNAEALLLDEGVRSAEVEL